MFEYKTITILEAYLEIELNNFSKNGYELVTITPHNNIFTLIFKKPIEEQRKLSSNGEYYENR